MCRIASREPPQFAGQRRKAVLAPEPAPKAPAGTGGSPAVAGAIGPSPDTTTLSDADREALVAWGLTVGTCATCGQEDVLPSGKPARRCRMTCGCEGRVRSITTSVPGTTRGGKQKQGESQ